MQFKDIPKPFHISRLFAVLLFVLPARSACAQNSSAAENYARNRAGVVMVTTRLSAIVNVSQLRINNSAFNTLVDSIQQLQSDSMRLTAGQKLDIILNSFRNNADKYFKSTLSYLRYAKRITTTGTGFFVSGDGYVVTNCHVVDEADNYIRRRLISSVFRQVTASNIQAIESSWDVNFSDAQRDELYNTFAGVYSSILPISLDSLKKVIHIVISSNENGAYRLELPARIIVKGSSMPGKDVAILKVEGKGPFPTINISRDPRARVGQNVFVYGYPETVTNNEFLSRSTSLEPTLTNGIISAWKKTTLNWPVMQMDATINHGNSGGPVCNEKGEVIGITTFGSLDAGTGSLAAGFNFAIPVGVLNEFFTMAGISPSESHITAVFNEGLSFFDRGYYHKALDKFMDVQTIYPAYPGLTGYLEDCRRYIKENKDQEPGSLAYLCLVAGVVLLVILSVIWLNLYKR